MALRNLHHLFEPTTVAVIGATERPGSVGQIVLSNLLEGPTLKGVFPVNPKRDKLLGAKAFKSIGDVPVVPDLAVVCTPAATVPDVVAQCAAKGIKGVIVLSAGFREIGEAGMALDAQLEKVIRDAGDMRVMGPNCLGAILPHLKLNVSFASGMPAPGQVAFISQSGALCTSVLDWAAERNIGFSHFVSMGNMMNVTFADMLDYVGTSAHTRSVILYIESIPDARAFVSAARAFSRTKPIIAYKAGRFAASAEAAASHTGALAGEDAVYDAAFRRAGIERVFEVDEMFACAELLGRQSTVPGERLTIVTNAGGPGVMASDTLLAHDGVLAELTPATVEKLNGQLPPFWSHANPIDVLGDAGADRYQTAIAAALADANTDAVLVILTPQAMTDATGTAQAVVDASKANRGNRKPIITAWMGGPSVREGAALLKAAGIPNYATPERAINAHMHLVSTARNRELLHETPRELPPLFDVQLTTRRTDSHRLLGDAPGTLSEADAKKLLDAYGIPVTLPHPATTADQAVTAARRVGYPVVLKVDVDGITHTTDVGGVELNLLDEEDVRTAFDRIEKRVRHQMGERPVNMGVTVQKMIHAE
ncbi:MAG: acetate--CoA ligase family protein, partial [Planctomycetota bacterium]